MSSNTNLVGNVTRDPELKFMNNGQAQCRLGIAVNRRWQNKQTQEWEERTSFFTVIAYGKLGENVANCVNKGTRVNVSGRLEQRTWDKEDGTKGDITEVIADDIAVSLSFATVQVFRADAGVRVTGNASGTVVPQYSTVEEAF